MTTRPPTSGNDRPQAGTCSAFEERLPAWLEGQLDDAERPMMERHHVECASCAALMTDIDRIVQEATALPLLTPSRDLWRDIESRLAAPVIPLGVHREESAMVAGASRGRRRSVSVRWMAVAATVLVAVSAGVTWTVARASFGTASVPASTVATADAPRPTSIESAPGASAGSPSALPAPSTTALPASTVAAGESVGARGATGNEGERGGGVVLRAASMIEVDRIYEREIAALRRIVDERFAELDSVTVTELRNNLHTIDRAIDDSRRALARDPRSRVLSSELDRTLEAKLSLMRRLALL